MERCATSILVSARATPRLRSDALVNCARMRLTMSRCGSVPTAEARLL
jgi:hypothetical protein